MLTSGWDTTSSIGEFFFGLSLLETTGFMSDLLIGPDRLRRRRRKRQKPIKRTTAIKLPTTPPTIALVCGGEDVGLTEFVGDWGLFAVVVLPRELRYYISYHSIVR